MPRWAYDPPAGAIVEPDSGHAEDGFASAERPPAQWINYLLHYQLAWCDYLRGPAWGQWSRAAHGGTIATLTSVTGLAVDTDDARARSQRYRYAIVGAAAGPTAKIGVSRNGLEWQDRSIPASCTALYGIARIADRWLLWGYQSATAKGYTTIADDGSANSAIGTDDATKWSVVAELSGIVIGACAWNGGTDAYVINRGVAGSIGLMRSTDSGASWLSLGGYAWASGSEYGTGIAWDDSRSRYVIAGSLGAIGSYTPSTSTTSSALGAVTGIPTDADLHVVVGGPEDSRTLIAWASYRYDRTTALASTLIWRSTGGGTSWTAVTLPTGMSAITDLIHVDGVWLATSSTAPYLWRSDDDGTNWERVPLPVDDTLADWPLQRAVYGDGQIVCTGLTWTVTSGRASATSPGTWTSTEPGYLADAGYLRGRRIHTTAPTNGQVYAWNSGTSRWEPVTLTAPLSGAAGGDLGGTYPNPTVTSGTNHGHTASQVTDSTAAGRAVLTAIDEAAGRGALGVQDGPRLIPLFGYATADSATPAVQALAGFTPADYAITGRTTVLTLDAIGSVTGAGLTGTLEILDSGGTVVASIDWIETTPTRKTDAIALPVGAEIYRARVSCTGVTDPLTEYALLGGANIRITWS